MFFKGIAIFFHPYAIGEWWLNKIQEGNPILLLGHPLFRSIQDRRNWLRE